MLTKIPRDKTNNTSKEIIFARHDFIKDKTGEKLHHIKTYSVAPETTFGNIENFIGVAQVPIGLAGPLTVNGEHANGQFCIPTATTKGTLVASYNRGMRLLKHGR